MSGHEKERDTVEPTETDVIKSEEDPFRVLKDAVPLRRFPDLVMVLDTPKGKVVLIRVFLVLVLLLYEGV